MFPTRSATSRRRSGPVRGALGPESIHQTASRSVLSFMSRSRANMTSFIKPEIYTTNRNAARRNPSDGHRRQVTRRKHWVKIGRAVSEICSRTLVILIVAVEETNNEEITRRMRSSRRSQHHVTATESSYDVTSATTGQLEYSLPTAGMP